MKKTKQTIIILLLLLVSPCILFAHDWIRHANDLCYAMFGYSKEYYNPKKEGNINEMKNSLGEDDQYYKAFEIMKNAVAVAIDYTNSSKNDTAYFYLYDIKNNLKHGLPERTELMVKTARVNLSGKGPSGNHRNVCHQGFDYQYTKEFKAQSKTKDETEYNKNLKKMKELDTRWALGRQLLIDAASYAFDLKPHPTHNKSIATFIAMNAYYIHLLGDLEKPDFKDLYPIGSYRLLLNEYTNKIESYGKHLPKNCTYMVNSLIEKMNNYLTELNNLPNNQLEGKDLVSFKYTKNILNILHEYLPEIIKKATYISNYSKVS